MAVNKVMDSVGNVLVDLTSDTVTADKVLQGYTFHDRAGNVQTGTAQNIVQGIPHEDWVMFFDYKGNLVETWTYEELQQASALPNGPDHTGENITFEEWNYTLEDLLEQESPVVVGETCKTSDDITYIVISNTGNVSSPTIRIAIIDSSEVTIDWGDDTLDTVTTTQSITHTYASQKEYTIKISSTGMFYIGGGTTSSTLIGNGSAYRLPTVLDVKFSKYTKIQPYLFYSNAYCNLKYVNFHKNIFNTTSITSSIFSAMTLNCIVFPRGILNISNLSNIQFGNTGLTKVISIPNTVTSATFGTNTMLGALEYLTIPKHVTNAGPFSGMFSLKTFLTVPSLMSYLFNNTYSLSGFHIKEVLETSTMYNVFCQQCTRGKDITYAYGSTRMDSVSSSAFHRVNLPSTVTSITFCQYIEILDISTHETVPTLSNIANVYSPNGSSRGPKIIIGYGMMSQYAAATNWSTLYAYGLLEEATE